MDDNARDERPPHIPAFLLTSKYVIFIGQCMFCNERARPPSMKLTGLCYLCAFAEIQRVEGDDHHCQRHVACWPCVWQRHKDAIIARMLEA